MKKTTIFLTLIVISLLTTNQLFSQTKEQPWSVGLHGNMTTYQGDLGNYWFDFSGSKIGAAITATRYISPFFDARAKISYTGLEIYDENGTYAAGAGGYADLVGTPYGSWGFDGKLLASTLNLIFKFNNGVLMGENKALKPFLIGGFGETRFKSNIRRDKQDVRKYHNITYYYGLGLKYTIQDKYNIILEAGMLNNMNDDLDGITDETTSTHGGWKGAGESNDEFLQFSLGITANLGKAADSDNDGVSDKKDQCPNTPKGVEVDKKGCPLDRDKDGVADYNDECPDVKGTIKGCPDKDKDKIADKNDDCPTEKGLPKLKGCPDTDRDGIADKNDKCPNKKGPRSNNGCPYPDKDGDGIADKDDKCPNRKGPRSNNGCPIPVKKQKDVTITDVIYFKTNSARIQSQYSSVIDKMVSLMKKDGVSKLIIAGHTDSDASDSYNMGLSQRRAKAVKDYIIKKGVSSGRIKTNAFGETRPIASNKTPQGKQLNRRGEIKLILK